MILLVGFFIKVGKVEYIMTKEVTLIATSAMGLEAIVAREVKELGYEPQVDNGKIKYTGPVSAIPRSNLWLRVADRVKLVVGEFEARTFDDLFEATKALPWEQFITEDGKFPVSGKSHKSKLFSVSDCQAIVKKSIAERLKWKHGMAGKLPETGALYKVEVAILKDKVTLTLDTSGEGLHKRGYRIGQGDAPLRETLAAALVLLTNWKGEAPLIDPFCGSGTLLIEAAMIGQNIAPGFNRSFASEEWDFIKKKYWDQAFEEADKLADYDKELDITGTDIDQKMVEIARNNALEAGLADIIEWKQMQLRDLVIKEDNGYLIGNPPYGERISDEAYVKELYATLGSIMEAYPSWSSYVITSYKGYEEAYGKEATRKRKLFNGFIETNYYQYFGQRS